MATILIVDDYSPSHRLLGFILEQDGHSVVTALNGLEALDRLAEMPVDLIVTDLSMPSMDGVELVEHVRLHERYQVLPVIMVTASCKERDLLRASSIGVNAFLTKPVDSEELVQAVQHSLRQRALPPTAFQLRQRSTL